MVSKTDLSVEIISLYTFIIIFFKLFERRCRCQTYLNMESPEQNHPSKFPHGKKHSTQETDMTEMIVCLHAGYYISVCESQYLHIHALDSCLGKKGTDLEHTQFSPPQCAILIRVTHDSWVKATLLRETGPQFYHSLPFGAVAQQMTAFLMCQTAPNNCMGLFKQEGNVRGQIKSGVGCLIHGWLPPLALKFLSSLLNTFQPKS